MAIGNRCHIVTLPHLLSLDASMAPNKVHVIQVREAKKTNQEEKDNLDDQFDENSHHLGVSEGMS